jgi:hypothetical protein
MSEPLKIRFETIERQFDLIGYFWFDGTWQAAVTKDDEGYRIRVLMSRTVRGADTTDKYDYFEIAPDGIIRKSPRGYARDFNKLRMTGLDEAVAKYARVGETA